MRGTPPFSDLTEAGICARVIYQLVIIDHRRNPERYTSPSDGLSQLTRDLFWYKNAVMQLALHSAIEYVASRRGKLERWRDDLVLRSRARIALNRIGDPFGVGGAPPVSNTGGTATSLADIEALNFYYRERARVRGKRRGNR